MTVSAALVREQGHAFAVVLIREQVISNEIKCRNLIADAEATFGCRAVLMSDGSLTTYGHADIVNFLEDIEFGQLPWADYSLN